MALLVVTAGLVVITPSTGLAFNGALAIDDFARFIKVLVLGGAALVLIMGQSFLKREKLGRFEFPVLVVFSVLGMMVMASAADFITLYLGLELQSLALYVLAAFDRDNVRSTEAGLKYFVLGALSSGMMLYGISLIYGFTGTTSFADVAMIVSAADPSIGLIFGLVFLIAGLAFKVSAVPFHMWTPDVYEGAPTPITAFFAASPKIAAMALFSRAVIEAFPGALAEWRQIVIFISILSMVLGAFAAIGQNNIKRLMAYSSIANMGYILVGLAAGTAEGVQGVLIYLAIYLITNVGVFACILGMRRGPHMVENISDLSGTGADAPRLRLRVRDADVQPGRHSAARGLLRQVLRLPRGRAGGALSARRDRRRRERGRRLLLCAHREDHLLRRARAGLRARHGREPRRDHRRERRVHGVLPSRRGAVDHGGGRCRRVALSVTLPKGWPDGVRLIRFDEARFHQ